MLLIALLFLLPSLVVGDQLTDSKQTAFCAFQCMLKDHPPQISDKSCLRLVNNVTAVEGNGRWAYDRLVFEGPDCGVYTFVIKTKGNVTMKPLAPPKSEDDAIAASFEEMQCLNKCGGGLIKPGCDAYLSYLLTKSRGWINYETWNSADFRGQTVYRAVQYGCENEKTTIVRVYRREFEILAELGQAVPNSPVTYSEVWSINRGFLQVSPTTSTYPITPVDPGSVDKNICGLKCFGLKEPTPYPPFPTGCHRTLANATVADPNGRWVYHRDVYEGPECGVYNFLITTTGNVSMIDPTTPGTHQVWAFNSTYVADKTICLRSCGFDVCDTPKLTWTDGKYLNEATESLDQILNHGQFECNGVMTAIVRSFRKEPEIQIELVKAPKFYSEKWKIANGQLLTENIHF